MRVVLLFQPHRATTPARCRRSLGYTADHVFPTDTAHGDPRTLSRPTPRGPRPGQGCAHAARPLKADLRRGLHRRPPALLATAKLADVLLVLPGHGPVKVRQLLERCQVSPRKSFAALTPRQGEMLSAALRGRSPYEATEAPIMMAAPRCTTGGEARWKPRCSLRSRRRDGHRDRLRILECIKTIHFGGIVNGRRWPYT